MPVVIWLPNSSYSNIFICIFIILLDATRHFCFLNSFIFPHQYILLGFFRLTEFSFSSTVFFLNFLWIIVFYRLDFCLLFFSYYNRFFYLKFHFLNLWLLRTNCELRIDRFLVAHHCCESALYIQWIYAVYGTQCHIGYYIEIRVLGMLAQCLCLLLSQFLLWPHTIRVVMLAIHQRWRKAWSSYLPV